MTDNSKSNQWYWDDVFDCIISNLKNAEKNEKRYTQNE